MNQINVIHPYKWNGLWVFDDSSKGLTKEPFVGDTNTIIDSLTSHIDNASDGFRLWFSRKEFPDYQAVIEREEKQSGGRIYRCLNTGVRGWLCPALFKYFRFAPKRIYIKCEKV